MRRFAALLRAGLKSNFALSVLRYRLLRKRKDLWLLPLVLLAGLGALSIVYYYVQLLRAVYGLLAALGQQAALLTFGLVTGQLVILVFGLFYVISAFYFSRDLDVLIPLPVRPFEVMLSKFAVILVNEYLTVALLVCPILIEYGILSKARWTYWLGSGLVYFFLPMIPLAMVGVIVLVLMRFVNLGRKKDALMIIGSIVLVALGISVQFWINRSARALPDSAAMVSFFSSPEGLVQKIGSRFPPSIWATRALNSGLSSASGIGALLLLAGVSILLIIGLAAGAEALFYRGLIGLGETSRRGKRLSRGEMARRMSSGRRPVRALFMREWRIMNRTPIFLLNGTVTVLIVPVVLLVMSSTGSRDADFRSLLKMLTSGNSLAAVLASAAFMTICGSLNGTAASAVSREGGQFWISKVIPVAPRDQVAAKFLHSYLIALLGIGAAAAVLLWRFGLAPAAIVSAVGLALAASFVLTSIGLAIDLRRPLLDWINPQKAIKQNLNVLIAFLADAAVLAALGFGCRFLAGAGLSPRGVLVVLGAALVGLAAASWRLLARYADRRYPAIDI